jgi:hypothetical protein
MSKRAELNPKANSKPKPNRSPLAKVQGLTLFGSPQLLLHGEDATTYDQLLGRFCAAIKPVDIIDEMLIDDAVSLEWDVLRWRRLKSSLMRTLELRALEQFLCDHLDYDQYWKFFEEILTEILQDNLKDRSDDDAQTLAHKCAQNDLDADDRVNQILAAIDMDIEDVLKIAKPRKAKELAHDYVRRKPGALKLIDKLLARASLSIDALMVRTLPEQLDNIERIDRLITIAETRRNAMLREIDRRRAALGEALRRQVQEVEAEFEVIEKTPAETKSAA